MTFFGVVKGRESVITVWRDLRMQIRQKVNLPQNPRLRSLPDNTRKPYAKSVFGQNGTFKLCTFHKKDTPLQKWMASECDHSKVGKFL